MECLKKKPVVKVMFTVPRDHNYHLIRQGAGNAVAKILNILSCCNKWP